MPQHRTHVLLVDDDVMLCRGLTRSLRQHQVDVHSTHCAAEALAFLAANPVDAILLDWILPDRDGVALLQHLRAQGITTPVIMLTGENTVEGKVRALNRGADDYLAKPVAVEELIARLHALLRRASGSPNTPRAGRITVDPWKQEAAVDGERIDLTPIEIGILSLLVRHADEIVTRKQIMDAVWNDKGADTSARALGVQLTRLRRKLGDAADQIETVRGAGLRLRSTPRSNS